MTQSYKCPQCDIMFTENNFANGSICPNCSWKPDEMENLKPQIIEYQGGQCKFKSLFLRQKHDIRPIWKNSFDQIGWYCNKCGLTIIYVQQTKKTNQRKRAMGKNTKTTVD